MNSIIELKNLTFGYGNNLIFKDTSLIINKGEFVAIIGENGSGKSTLMKLITGELKPNSGYLKLNFNGEIGYVPQLSAAKSNNFPITVEEILALNLHDELKKFRKIDEENKKKIDYVLNLVGLNGYEKALFGDLSGGQKQKAILGKALISNPELLLLDEPLIGLDKESKNSFLKLLNHQCKHHGISIVMITHELEEAKKYVDRVITIEKKKVVEL